MNHDVTNHRGVQLMMMIDETGRALAMRAGNWREIKRALDRAPELQLRGLLVQITLLRGTVERNLEVKRVT